MITDQGRIACANVLSDLYAMGVVDCHNMLMLLAGGIDLDGDDEKHRRLYSSQWPRRCLRQRGTWWFHSWCRFALFLQRWCTGWWWIVMIDAAWQWWWCRWMVMMIDAAWWRGWCWWWCGWWWFICLLQGFQDTAQEAGCLVTGGQTVIQIKNCQNYFFNCAGDRVF